MLNSDFSDAKVGDKVTSLLFGYGEIINVYSPDEVIGPYVIEVKYIAEPLNDRITINGLLFEKDFAPTFYKGHIDPASFQVSYKTIE